MDVLSCTVGGQTVALHIRRTAKKNIIARPRDTGSLNVSIPPRLPLAAVSQWAQTNQNALAELLRHASPASALPVSALPEQILFGGHWHSVKPAPVSGLAHDPAARMFRLPAHLTPQAQTELLRRHAKLDSAFADAVVKVTDIQTNKNLQTHKDYDNLPFFQ